MHPESHMTYLLKLYVSIDAVGIPHVPVYVRYMCMSMCAHAVCMNTRYVHTHVRPYICTSASIHACMHACMHLCRYVCMYVCLFACLLFVCLYVCVRGMHLS